MSRRRTVAQHLAEVPMFAVCTKSELTAMSKLVTEVDVAEGKILTKEGQPGKEFVIVLDGEAVATKNGRKVASFGAGDYFGEIALLDPGPRTATVVAQTPMTLAVIGPNEFSAALDAVPTLSAKLLRGLARRLREVENHKVV